jgi:hypothetical protein
MDFGGWKPIHGLVPGEEEAGSLHTHDTEQVSKQNILKGIVSREEYFLKVLKQYFLDERLWFSQYSVVFLLRKSKMKFLLASMKSLTNCEISSSNPHQRACSGFPIAACVVKSCSETRL